MFGVQAETYKHATKKYLFEILKERYQANELMIDRLCHFLVTEQDIHDFLKIVADAFERGYMKAVADYEEKLNALGYNVKVVAKN